MYLQAAIDYTMPNAKEASLLSGSPHGSTWRSAAAMGLRKHPGQSLARDGAAMLRYRTAWSLPQRRRRTSSVVDTTGAGDVFDAGFIDALLDNGATPQEMI